MPLEMGASSRIVPASAIAPREERVDDVSRSLLADLPFFLRGESASVHSMRKSAPMKPSATFALSGSESSALKSIFERAPCS
jgi:hypothetical protein